MGASWLVPDADSVPPCLPALLPVVRSGLAAEAVELRDLETVSVAAVREAESLGPLLGEVGSSLEEERQAAQRASACLADTEAVRTRKLGALRAALALYRDRLGLSFVQHPDGLLRIGLAAVDPRDAERSWSFAVAVGEGDAYIGAFGILDCTFWEGKRDGNEGVPARG